MIDRLGGGWTMSERAYDDETIRRYRRSGLRRVPGWLASTDADLVMSVADAQTATGVAGAVGEIGVFHGKLFILLALQRHVGEETFAVDVFDQDHLNVDQSGANADERSFRAHVRRHVSDDLPVHLFRRSSTQVTPEDILSAVGPVRLFSIDGGHTADIAAHDIALAAEVLAPDGVAIVDDVFNPQFPGVAEGFHRVLGGADPPLVPSAIGFNKVFLCRPDATELYRREMIAAVPGRYDRSREFLGHDAAVFRALSPRERLTHTAWWSSVRERPEVVTIRRQVRRVVG